MGSMGGVRWGGGLALAILCLITLALVVEGQAGSMEKAEEDWGEEYVDVWEEEGEHYVDYDNVNYDYVNLDGDGLRDHVDDPDDDNDGIPDIQDDDDDGDGIR